MEGFGEIMGLEKTDKYLKTGKSLSYKMARKGKILARGDNVYKIKRFCLFF